MNNIKFNTIYRCIYVSTVYYIFRENFTYEIYEVHDDYSLKRCQSLNLKEFNFKNLIEINDKKEKFRLALSGVLT